MHLTEEPPSRPRTLFGLSRTIFYLLHGVPVSQAVMQLTDEQKRGIQAAWRVCMDQSRRVLQQREVALAELDMRGMSLQREGDFSLEMRKVH